MTMFVVLPMHISTTFTFTMCVANSIGIVVFLLVFAVACDLLKSKVSPRRVICSTCALTLVALVFFESPCSLDQWSLVPYPQCTPCPFGYTGYACMALDHCETTQRTRFFAGATCEECQPGYRLLPTGVCSTDWEDDKQRNDHGQHTENNEYDQDTQKLSTCTV